METPRAYRVLQLGRPDPDGNQQNASVTSFQDLVTHHPYANRYARMEDGTINGVERPARRSHAFIAGSFEEVIDQRVDKNRDLSTNQILLVKDFILEDPSSAPGLSPRKVDVPSPTVGHVTRVSASAGLVELSDPASGQVIARVRHLREIPLSVGDQVQYGQSLGTQGNAGMNVPAGQAIHVHLEMDLSRYGDYQAYVEDLLSGRLAVQAQFRQSLSPRVVDTDATFRLGESHSRIRDLQRVMANEGYRAAGGGPLDQDGVYRLGMQGALLDFQHDHGVRQTGDIDPATLQFAPRARGRAPDLPDHFQPGLPMPRMAEPATAPGHPDHADHRPGLPAQPEPRINRRDEPSAILSPLLLPLAEALRRGDERSLSDACADIAGSNRLQEILREAREQARQADAPQLSAHGHWEDAPLLVPA